MLDNGESITESYFEELSNSLIVDEDVSFSFKSSALKQILNVKEFKHDLGAIRLMDNENVGQDMDQTLGEETSNEDKTISCLLCIQSRIFDKPKELLWHFSFSHFSQEILLVHPFTDGEDNLCELCLHQEPYREYILDSLSVHLNHLGVYHGVVLQFLPEHLAAKLVTEPTICNVEPIKQTEEFTEEKGVFESGSIVESAEPEEIKNYSPILEGQYDDQVLTSINDNVATQIKVFSSHNNQERAPMIRTIDFEEHKQKKEAVKDVFDNAEDSDTLKEYTNNYDQLVPASLQPKEVVKSNECSKKEDTTANITADEASEESVAKMERKVLCKLCPKGPSNNIEYSKRQTFLKHLTLKHFSTKLLQDCPYIEGQSCTDCQRKSKAFVATRKELHVCHVGIMHGKVFDLLSKDLLNAVSSMATDKKSPEEKFA